MKLNGLLRGSAILVCLSWAAGTALGQATGYMSPVGQVGQRTAVSNFGRLGGRTTTSSNYLQSLQRGGAPPPGPTGNYLGQAKYDVSTAVGGSQVQPNGIANSLNQNAAMASRMFGPAASTSALGRVAPRSSGSAMDYLVPTINNKAAAARLATYYNGRTPAAAMLDRSALLAPKSALGRMATGPRNSLALHQQLSAVGDDGSAAPDTAAPGMDPLDGAGSTIPAGLSPSERREYKTQQEFQGCLERGDDSMRAKDFHRAKASYERARTISPDSAAPYCRLFMATLLMTDYAQAGMYLRLATRRAKDVGDMRMDPAECTPSVEDLRVVARTIAQANMRAETTEAEFVTLAYLSWLLDDPAIMRSELERAARIATDNPESAKLRAMLAGGSTTPPRS